ncbi:MAG: septation protein A [Gammaproteobacteria bacterium]|nr:MAG: septation protein A [Gammaproteobacteria bacterium]
MRLLLDFFPILLFFVAYRMDGIYTATAVAILATLALVAGFWWRHRRVERMHLVTLGVILVFGGATLLFRDPVYIKWKPTVAYGIFALVFLGSMFVGERNLTERMLGHLTRGVPPRLWRRLNLAWVAFFVAAAGLNLFVAYHFPEATWVNFKLFGLLGLTFLFVLAQTLVLSRYLVTDGDRSVDGNGS